jgi:hypothetical protein
VRFSPYLRCQSPERPASLSEQAYAVAEFRSDASERFCHSEVIVASEAYEAQGGVTRKSLLID